MQVTVNLSKKDLILFNLHAVPRMKATYRSFILLASFIGIVVLIENGLPETGMQWIYFLISVGLGGLAGGLVGILFCLFSILMTSSKENGILGEHVYTIDEQGFHEKTTANEGLNRWTGVQSVAQYGPYLVFQISSYLFHVLPERSFSSREQFLDFKRLAISAWRSAK